MMNCDSCGEKEATVFLTQIVDGKMQKVNLCDACSKAKGVNDPTGFALADLLLGLGAAQQIEKGPTVLKCEVCGFTQADFKKTGRLGCSGCYETFAEGLSEMLSNMHKGTRHTGKIPQHLAERLKRNQTISTLQQELDQAVASEEYETAAKLRDTLKQMEITTVE
jgi:protein arginine kinase activator